MAKGEMALLMIAAAGACGGDAPSGPFVIADSLGVEVVTNAAPVWDEARAWSVETEPSLSIGRVEGDSDYLFGRVVSAGWLNDGRIFAGDEPAHTVRVYSPEGIHELNVGREGEGPGELGSILTVEPYRGDSLFVYDYSRREVNVFDHDLQSFQI